MSHTIKLSRLSSVGVAVLGLLFLLALIAHAQDAKPPAKELKPTEVQTLRLQNKQLIAQIAQRDLQAAQQRFQTALIDLTAEAEKVKSEQGWPKDTAFDPNTIQFSPAPPPVPDSKPTGPPVVPATKGTKP